MAVREVAPATTADAAAHEGTVRPGRRAIATRVGMLLGILVVVFVLILPRVVDYGTVLTAISTLTPGQLAALAGATALAYVANAAPSWVMIPGLSWRRAVGADLAGRAVVSTIPGPTDIATKFALYRQWAIPADIATAGIVFNAFFETLADLVLPLIATVGVLIVGHEIRPSVFLLSIAGLGALALAMLLLFAVVRSEPLARRLAGGLESILARVTNALHRPPPRRIVERVMRGRLQAHDMLSRRGALGYGAAVLARLAWFLVLQVALWSVGVTSDVLPPAALLVAMAAVALLALLPITPGAVGVTEVAYLGLLGTVAGDAMTAQITAAIVIFRTVQWFVPIPLGWVLLVIMRGRRWRHIETDEPTTSGADARPSGGPA